MLNKIIWCLPVNSRVCVCRCACVFVCVCVVARRHENKHMFTCKLHNNNAATPTPNKTQIIRCILLGCKSKLYGDFFLLTVISAEKRVATATQPQSRQCAASFSLPLLYPSPLPPPPCIHLKQVFYLDFLCFM